MTTVLVLSIFVLFGGVIGYGIHEWLSRRKPNASNITGNWSGTNLSYGEAVEALEHLHRKADQSGDWG